MIHKLANGPLVLTVSDIASVEGQFGVQTQIDGEDTNGQDVRVFVSEMTAMRQLARLNLTPETVLGMTLKIEQVKKDGKTYTDFDIVRPGTVAVATAPRAAQATATASPRLTPSEAGAVYAQCVAQAMASLGAQLEEAGVAVDAAALQAAAATIFIKVTR